MAVFFEALRVVERFAGDTRQEVVRVRDSVVAVGAPGTAAVPAYDFTTNLDRLSIAGFGDRHKGF
jgi:hypothetical protein